MLLRRRKRPIGVSRGSLNTLKTGPVCTFRCERNSRSVSAPTFIERNLYIVKDASFSPARTCVKNTGPGDVSLITSATNTNTGLKTISAAPDATMSTIRLVTS